ncbi:MAG: hypothetical protein GY791_20090 [Alphaproteobacteria bacterium]|nr:hypothetical protein [Alphaproteobacteria bacterium]
MANIETSDRTNTDPGAIDRPIYDFLAPLLALWLPAFVFLFHHGYPLYRPEALLFISLMTGLALVCALLLRRSSRLWRAVIVAMLVLVFIDIQFDELERHFLVAFLVAGALTAGGWLLQRHWLPLVVIVLGVMSVVTVILIGLGLYFSSKPVQAERTGDSTLPLAMHLILDEHIGPAGLPDTDFAKDLGGRLRSLYVDNGFRLYGGAFSEYFHTRVSLSHLFGFEPKFNPDAEQNYERQVARENAPYNAYFRRIADWGYDLRITQLRYMRFCSDRTTFASSCRTYNGNLSALDQTNLPVLERARILFAFYFSLSHFGEMARDTYRDLRPRIANAGYSLPEWSDGATEHVTPIAAMDELNGLIERLESARRGEFHFAHILLPHYPYVYDETCRIRPYDDWLLRRAADLEDGATNTAETRALRYQRYLAQIGCLSRRIEELFAVLRRRGLYEDAIILVHGDHGSRINLADPKSSHYQRTDRDGFRDNYSTLFAIKAPSIQSGYDPSQTSIHALFAGLVDARFREVPAVRSEDELAENLGVSR